MPEMQSVTDVSHEKPSRNVRNSLIMKMYHETEWIFVSIWGLSWEQMFLWGYSENRGYFLWMMMSYDIVVWSEINYSDTVMNISDT